jgi:hypothetical protein
MNRRGGGCTRRRGSARQERDAREHGDLDRRAPVACVLNGACN